MWWVYFAHTKPTLEETVEARQDDARSALARDVYSLLHFPVLCGVVAVAVAVEEAVAHPDQDLSVGLAASFVAGLTLFLLGLAAAQRRAVDQWLWHRVPIVLAAAALVAVARPISPAAVLVVGVLALAAVALLEERPFDPDRSSSPV